MPVVDPHVHLELDDGMRVGSGPHPLDDYLVATAGMDLRASGVLVMTPRGDQFGWVCRTVGVDRLLWASDYPLDHPAESLAALGAYTFDREQVRAITHDNAVELFGLQDLVG